jgi:calcineurin-like phosphoesterase family protein
MGKGLITKYNQNVRVDDTVYFLGDLSLKGIEFKPALNALVGRMNGEKHLILGNHDRLSVRDYLEMGFKSVHSSLDLDTENITLVHDPAVAYTYPSRIFLCGHVHIWWCWQNNAINVGVDVWNYAPVSLPQIRNLLTEKYVETITDKEIKY